MLQTDYALAGYIVSWLCLPVAAYCALAPSTLLRSWKSYDRLARVLYTIAASTLFMSVQVYFVVGVQWLIASIQIFGLRSLDRYPLRCSLRIFGPRIAGRSDKCAHHLLLGVIFHIEDRGTSGRPLPDRSLHFRLAAPDLIPLVRHPWAGRFVGTSALLDRGPECH